LLRREDESKTSQLISIGHDFVPRSYNKINRLKHNIAKINSLKKTCHYN